MNEKKEVPFGKNIREIIFGVEDGAIGNLGVVVGMAQAAAPNKLILLAGLATMLTQSLSMSAGTYLSVKSEKEYFHVKSKVRHYGQEYSRHQKPVWSALVMGFFVIVGAFIPLSVFLFRQSQEGIISSITITLMGLFLLGAAKAKYTEKNLIRSGIEVSMVGVIAAGVGYLIGRIFG
ncbi:VIT1/CCC1 transporter family protein [Candidatus Woesearchaeota archaeon]|nr:VIT1/CCC1 transporter family protein [Candidatus Woesearchaeota archaeon]